MSAGFVKKSALLLAGAMTVMGSYALGPAGAPDSPPSRLSKPPAVASTTQVSLPKPWLKWAGEPLSSDDGEQMRATDDFERAASDRTLSRRTADSLTASAYLQFARRNLEYAILLLRSDLSYWVELDLAEQELSAAVSHDARLRPQAAALSTEFHSQALSYLWQLHREGASGERRTHLYVSDEATELAQPVMSLNERIRYHYKKLQSAPL